MATYFEFTELPKNTVAGVQVQFALRARNADGSLDTGFTGTVVWTSTDSLATLPATYTFTGGDAGLKRFKVRFRDLGLRRLTATSGAITGLANTTVATRPPGWGYDDHGLVAYGDALSGAASLRNAKAFSTREVDDTVTNLVTDVNPFAVGDALNPATWQLQRLDTLSFLSVVGVTQVGTYTYRLLVFEEFGPVASTHRVSTTTLLDVGGSIIASPRQVDFLGVLDVAQSSNLNKLATRRVAARDLANSQTTTSTLLAGTLQVGADGDYKTVTGPELVKKLIMRRLISTPGDFFHMPEYGVGLVVKQLVPVSDLTKLKKVIEDQCRLETEVEEAQAALTFDPAKGVLLVAVRTRLKKTGESIEIGLTVPQTGVVL